MKRFIDYWMDAPHWLVVFGLLAVAVAFNGFATAILNQSYATSGFPVPYYIAQLSFDPVKLKEWYAYLIEHRSLDKYIHTQNIDFIFIFSTLLLHFIGLVFVSRLLPAGSRWRRIMLICAVVSIGAPLADALENLASYVMLANPLTFDDKWAYLYSTFAAIKFVMFVFAYIAAGVGLLLAPALFVSRLRRPRPV